MHTLNQEASSLEVALDNMPVGISWATLYDHKIIFMNRRFTEMFGYVTSDFSDIAAWVREAYPSNADRTIAAEKWDNCFSAPGEFELENEAVELRIRCKDGAIKTVLRSGVVLPGTGWALATYVDITSRKQNELLLRAAERRARESQAIYQLLIDHSPDMTILSPFDGSRRYVSPAVERMTGFTPSEFLAHNLEEMIHPDDRLDTALTIAELRNGSPTGTFQFRTLHKDGSYRWVEAVSKTYADPASQQPMGFVTILRDISEQKKREKLLAEELSQLSEAAALDDLTGIANRRRFNQTLSAEASRQLRSARDLSLLLIDVDFFKEYNDLYGHLAGDDCLRLIASVLHAALRRDADLAARIGGEEFVALLPMTSMDGAERVASVLLRAVTGLALPHAGSLHGVVTVSIGVACWPAGIPLDQQRLMQEADQALYRAKDGGRNMYRLQHEDAMVVVGYS